MIRCIAYVEGDLPGRGSMCGEPAYIFDRDRGGWVCAEHHGEEPSEDLTEATITLRIKTQATLIEHQLALKKIFLARAGRCLPTKAGGYSPTYPERASYPDQAITQGERSQDEPHKLCLLGSTPGPASRRPDAVNVFPGGRWP